MSNSDARVYVEQNASSGSAEGYIKTIERKLSSGNKEYANAFTDPNLPFAILVKASNNPEKFVHMIIRDRKRNIKNRGQEDKIQLLLSDLRLADRTIPDDIATQEMTEQVCGTVTHRKQYLFPVSNFLKEINDNEELTELGLMRDLEALHLKQLDSLIHLCLEQMASSWKEAYDDRIKLMELARSGSPDAKLIIANWGETPPEVMEDLERRMPKGAEDFPLLQAIASNHNSSPYVLYMLANRINKPAKMDGNETNWSKLIAELETNPTTPALSRVFLARRYGGQAMVESTKKQALKQAETFRKIQRHLPNYPLKEAEARAFKEFCYGTALGMPPTLANNGDETTIDGCDFIDNIFRFTHDKLRGGSPRGLEITGNSVEEISYADIVSWLVEKVRTRRTSER